MIKSRGYFIVVLVLSGLFMPGRLMAEVDGSPHDLINQGYVLLEEKALSEKCFFCHLPVTKEDQVFLEKLPPSVEYFSQSGLLCYSCHDGTTIVSPDVDASNSAFHPKSHPLRLGLLDTLELKEDFELPKITQKRFECISCHSPHDNNIRPFLRADIVNLCAVCHKGKVNEGYGAGNISSTHPVNETVEDDAGQASPIVIQEEFRVPFPDPYPLSGGREEKGVHWNRGGHIQSKTTGTAKAVECFTCHIVHGAENRAPVDSLLTVSPVREKADEFCEGCHRGQRGDDQKSLFFPNPGGTITGRTYHPCDDDESNGKGRIVKIREPAGWPMGEGSPATLICTTCHVAHGGLPGSALLRKPVTSVTFCEECHISELTPFHHPSGAESNMDGICQPGPADYSIGAYIPGKIYCSSCHVAHNAGQGEKEEDFIPILKFNYLNNTLCFNCHDENNYTCEAGKGGTASHFLGDPTLADTYDDLVPPERDIEWPATMLKSRYGGENSKEIICLSCHTFQMNPESGLKEPLESYLLAYSGDNAEWGEDLGVYICTGCHGDSPGGQGHSHPLMNADISNLLLGVAPPATNTDSGRLNCESCHSTHEAVTRGGYYIFKEVISDNEDPKKIHPQIDFTVLCHLCHEPGKY